MSRPRRQIYGTLPALLICAALFQGSAVHAVEEATRSEIVYRASFGRADDIALLIDQGASPDQINVQGAPILAVASARKDTEAVNVVKTLLKRGANISARDPGGQTALFYAAKSGNVEIVNHLLEQRIDALALDIQGDTALHAAGKAGQPKAAEAIEYFLKHQSRILQEKRAAELQAAKEEQERLAGEKIAADQARREALAQGRIEAQVAEALLAADRVASVPPALPPSSALPPPDQLPSLDSLGEESEDTAADPQPVPVAVVPIDAAPSREEEPQEPQEPVEPEEPIDEEALERKLEEDMRRRQESGQLQKDLRATRGEAVEQLSYQVAYHTCAFQYWSFCLQVKQNTELGSEELLIAIQSHKERVEALQKKMLVTYKVSGEAYSKVSDSAKRRVFDQLSGMRSNWVRREQGVGKMDDMRARCEEIGRQWGFPAAAPPPPDEGQKPAARSTLRRQQRQQR